jgi:hypothetical protein
MQKKDDFTFRFTYEGPTHKISMAAPGPPNKEVIMKYTRLNLPTREIFTQEG